MKKTGRNDPCVCGSGKKFKKCCERKMIGKRFMATKIENPKAPSSISSFFQNKITQVISNEKKVEELTKGPLKPMDLNVSKGAVKPKDNQGSENILPQNN